MIVAAGERLLRADGHDGRRSGNEREGDQNEPKDLSHESTSFEEHESYHVTGRLVPAGRLTFA